MLALANLGRQDEAEDLPPTAARHHPGRKNLGTQALVEEVALAVVVGMAHIQQDNNMLLVAARVPSQHDLAAEEGHLAAQQIVQAHLEGVQVAEHQHPKSG